MDNVVDIWFDFRCPFVHNASVWLRDVQQRREVPEIRWRSFPLEQVNAHLDNWLFWEQPLDEVRSLRAFLAAEAVREYDATRLSEFVFAVLDVVHTEKLPPHDLDTIRHAASHVSGLDADTITGNLDTAARRQRIASDYQEGTDVHGVFGTPTFLFPTGDPVFVKISKPPPDEAVGLWDSVQTVSQRQPYLTELKKPRRPERRS